MNLTLQRQSAPTKGGLTGAPRLPQVNLLPPEVRAARGLATTKRVLAAALVATLAVAGAGYGFAVMTSAAASGELEAAQAESARLSVEQAKYAEVPPVVNSLQSTKDALALGMSTEIHWKGYIDAITAVLPSNVTVKTLSVVQAAPAQPAPAPADVITAQGAATISFTIMSSTLTDAASLEAALNTVPGFYGATFSGQTLSEVNSVVGYEGVASVEVAEGAFTHRFDVTAEEN